ncbi:hypothetical protein KSP40_PGU008800 [Platanthera guangdongensis]|uniref:Uncharacterized protein n=1 Tax=Platanthera guangdongensis TaxID=2320717 RepID=A0ABR2N5B1_9ASPA
MKTMTAAHLLTVFSSQVPRTTIHPLMKSDPFKRSYGDFPGGHPSQNFSRPSTLNYEVLSLFIKQRIAAQLVMKIRLKGHKRPRGKRPSCCELWSPINGCPILTKHWYS